MRLKGKVAVITGGSGEIGGEIACLFAKEGARVIIGYNQGSAQALKAVAGIKKSGGKAAAQKITLSNLGSVESFFNKIIKKYKRVDVLVNSAGLIKDRLLMLMSENEWDEVMVVNLKGIFNCCRAVIKQMIIQKCGKIINLSSVSASKGVVGQTNYAASKAGVEGFTRALVKEVSRYGIYVNNIAPGLVVSRSTRDLGSEYLKMIPLARFGKPAEVAKAALFLASDDASYIQGQTLVVDGGLSA